MSSPDKRSLPRDAQRAFMQVVMSAEHELQRTTQRLRETLGATEEGDPRSLGQLLVDRARAHRVELEQRIEREVHATLAKVRAPLDREMDAMRVRIEKLGQKLDGLRR
jgi:hemerythrin-like domain-containing protein